MCGTYNIFNHFELMHKLARQTIKEEVTMLISGLSESYR